MNRSFWARPAQSPALNYDLANILSHAYDDDASYAIRLILTPQQQVGLSVVSGGLTSVRPPFTAWRNDWGMFVFVGGTSGTTHVVQLFNGWNDPNAGPHVESGASAGYARAAQEIIDIIHPADIVAAPRLYLVGHSYGGAVVQAMAAILSNASVVPMGIWTYGSPRPGTAVLQRRISAMSHWRFFNDNDPVRWIPPHSEEALLLSTITASDFLIGMNRQVQTSMGFQIDAAGDIQAATGEPTVLHQVGLSISNWCTDTHGFRSVNHSAAEYRRRFQLAMPIKPDGPARPRSQEQEEVGTIRPRALQDEIAAQVPTIESAVANPNSGLNTEVQQWPKPDARLVYKRRKWGPIWVVRFGEQIVDCGPGKRRAGQLARARNKVARASAV
jgi:pimeloyl-ACP methyl ester carboxylesterase